jgi:hypothetical protein
MRLGLGRLGLRRLGLSGLGFGGLGFGRLGFRSLGLCGMGFGRLGSRFRPSLGLSAARGLLQFLVGLLHRDLLLYGLLLARRFLISPFLAGRLVILGPRRGGAVQR